MAPSSSPTVRRRQLAAELRRLRQNAKLTIEQVAGSLDWSPGKVSRIENARNSVNQRDTRRLLDAYGVGEGPEREALLTLARQSRERGWWQQYGDAVPEWFATYVGLEAEASTISAYQSEIVPGLLQTPGYAAALHQAAMMTATAEEIEQHVKVRMERQQRLSEPDAPEFWVVLNEAVLQRIVGDRSIMHEQLAKLVEASSWPTITLQILPFGAGAHASMDSAFSIVSFQAPDGDVVYFEHPTFSVYVESRPEVARYKLVFNHLRASSLSPPDSQRLLARRYDDLA